VLGNYSNDYDVKCQLDTCKTYPAITDSERGEIFCGGCGLVLVDNMSDMLLLRRLYENGKDGSCHVTDNE
jgi:transcription initiation factor TFIIIB Brf1 subunit/transcription initiation factor TFIIB